MKEVYLNSLDIPSISRFAVGFDRMFNDLSRTAGALNGTNYPHTILLNQRKIPIPLK